MKFLKRLWSLISNRAHSALDRIESPDDKLKHFLNELQGKIAELQDSVTGAVVEEKKLQKALEFQLSESKKWEDRAKLALQEGKEDLARQALGEQQQVLSLAEATKSTLEVQQQAVVELKKSLISSKDKLGDARRQYQLAMARYKSAETKVKLADASSKTSNESPLKLLGELDDKILKLEAEAESQIELNSDDSSMMDLESQFKLLEQGKSIENRLEALRHDGGATLALPGAGSELKELLNKK